MKQKILYLAIGFLIGVVVTASGFLIFNNTHKHEFKDGPAQMHFDENRNDFKGRGRQEQRSLKSDSSPNSNSNNSKKQDDDRPELPNGEKPEGESSSKPEKSSNNSDKNQT